ncbi:MAG: hypothetical protein V2I51_21300, partial [Anderseniella sp.]|nr:hypothetical protein [Anderseniella sp.]
MTEEPATGWGTFAAAGQLLENKAYDIRGESTVSRVHQVTLAGLAAETIYELKAHSGSTTEVLE